MSNDDQQIFDTLFNLPTSVVEFTFTAVEAFERRCDDLAEFLRSAVGRAPPPLPAPPQPQPRLLLSQTLGRRTADFIWDNRAIISALVAFFGTGGVLYWRQRKNYMHKRRARRGAGGARMEVVVVAGNISSPITKSIVHDLERRQFIPYVIAESSRGEDAVDAIKRVSDRDIRFLNLDIKDPFDIEASIQNFEQTLTSPAQELRLAGLVVIPDTQYSSGPIQHLSPEIWADTFNTRLIHTIATIQAFIPILIQHKARTLILTPTIASSMQTPYHGVESATIAALRSFTATLHAELSPLSSSVTNIRLGNFDLGTQDKTAMARIPRSEVLSWPQAIKERYGASYTALAGQPSSAPKGSPLRELHNSIFDALTQSRSPGTVISVGRGSVLYPFVGRWVPSGLVGWMMRSR